MLSIASTNLNNLKKSSTCRGAFRVASKAFACSTANATPTVEGSSLSYVKGPTHPPLSQQTIGDMFDTTCRQHPNSVAIVAPFQETKWTYQELQHNTNKLAAHLLSIGMRPGDRLGIWSPNNVEWVVTQLATAKVGIILVNINPAYRLDELRYALNKVGCKGIVTAEEFKTSKYIDMLWKAAPELKTPNTVDGGGLSMPSMPHLRFIISLGPSSHDGITSYHELMANEPSSHEMCALQETASKVKPKDPINLQFTSGTTGQPKAATLSSVGLVNNGKIVGDLMKLTADDRVCVPVPLYHCFGMVLGNLACFTRGASVVLPNPDFCPKKTLEAVCEEECTALYGVPTMFQAMLNHPAFDRDRILSSGNLRTGIMAGTTCPVPLMRRVIEDMGMRDVTICYGMTETSPVSFQSSVDTPFERRVCTVGTVHPHVEAKVVDETGAVLPTGHVGELLTRGYLVMSGYWDDAERTANTIDKDGWMHTGDLASFTDDGHCQIEGRIKDVIIRGGENIYPREVEDFLLGCDGVAQVQVFGIPDELYGEVVCAWIKAQDEKEDNMDETTVREYCRDSISHFKIPKYIKFVDEFPMTVTGKPQKYKMREEMIKEVELQ